MYAIRKCSSRNICYFAYKCNRVADSNEPCELVKSHSPNENMTHEPIDLRAYTPEQDFVTLARKRFELGVDQT